MGCYMLVVIGIGLYFAKRAQKNTGEYFWAGAALALWVAAMSAEASDMSGWLLMGLPGLAYWVRLGGRRLDGDRAGAWHLCQLADRRKAVAEVFVGFRQCDHRAGVLQ